ncbi:SPBc2 prophage-derived glycosyltransferase SunS [Clostridium sp. C105KSO13]|nr:glycosyltransferase family 2 protein [Clostridium sp. C105KSO13]CUX48838.1 SPBc2 prophage-derived glycosyltransferase SunS [Clostridium sp. C105KSO13]
MITISLCMIVKDEENVLDRCLSSVADLVDEIIIVDTGSTDKTKQIAEKFTHKIFNFQWIDDFSAARNFAFEKAEMDYILWLDADDIIIREDQEKFMALKKELTLETDVVMMHYNVGFDENGKVTFSYFRERLVKRSNKFKWVEPVHECLQFWGNIVHADVGITHAKLEESRSDRNLKIYEKLLKDGKELSARGTYYYARELKDHKRYEDAILMFTKFLDSGLGWMEDNIVACSELAKCYQITENPQKVLQSMFRGFWYDSPRGEMCCQIGMYFKEAGKYRQAAFWFELVFSLEKPEDSWGFHQEDYWGYIPALECCICYDKLGEYEKAEAFNNLAENLKPGSAAVLYNKQYFENKRRDVTTFKKSSQYQ